MTRFTTAARVNGCNNFDIQLGAAIDDEDALAQALQHTRIELKTEKTRWPQTGNACVEFSYNGMPSGIAATEAHFWAHAFADGGQTLAYFLVPVPRLKLIANQAYRAGHVIRGIGDYGKSDAVLVTPDDLIFGFNRAPVRGR